MKFACECCFGGATSQGIESIAQEYMKQERNVHEAGKIKEMKQERKENKYKGMCYQVCNSFTKK